MQIRRVSLEAYRSELEEINKVIFPESDPPYWRGQWWLILEEKEIVGYAGATYWEPDRRVFLSRVGVLPAFRGKGTQRKAIRVRERWAKEIGALGCYTYVAPWNLASANSLISEGYRLWEPLKKFGVEGALYFAKDFDVR